MEPKFNPPQGGFAAELLCPSCGSSNLHHERVDIFERLEDQDQGLHIAIEDGKVKIDTDLFGNPSARRNGLNIYFSCENCSVRHVLAVAQHKGISYFEFNRES